MGARGRPGATSGQRQPQPRTCFTARTWGSGRAFEREVLHHPGTVKALAPLERYEVHERVARSAGSATAVSGSVEAFAQLPGEVDTATLEDVVARRGEETRAGIGQVEGELPNEDFLAQADPEVVAEGRALKPDLEVELELLVRNQAGLCAAVRAPAARSRGLPDGSRRPKSALSFARPRGAPLPSRPVGSHVLHSLSRWAAPSEPV